MRNDHGFIIAIVFLTSLHAIALSVIMKSFGLFLLPHASDNIIINPIGNPTAGEQVMHFMSFEIGGYLKARLERFGWNLILDFHIVTGFDEYNSI